MTFFFGCDEWSWSTRRCRIYICYCISDIIYFISKEIHKVITIKLWGNMKHLMSDFNMKGLTLIWNTGFDMIRDRHPQKVFCSLYSPDMFSYIIHSQVLEQWCSLTSAKNSKRRWPPQCFCNMKLVLHKAKKHKPDLLCLQKTNLAWVCEVTLIYFRLLNLNMACKRNVLSRKTALELMLCH